MGKQISYMTLTEVHEMHNYYVGVSTTSMHAYCTCLCVSVHIDSYAHCILHKSKAPFMLVHLSRALSMIGL